MKRVLFGYKGGFPLEQETLIQLQKAYSVDMLEALFALWGLDPAEKYLVKRATSATDDGWIIFPFETVQINPVDGSEIKVEKPQLLRLQYIDNSTQFNIVDLRETDGSLEYAQAGPDGSLEKKVYEEFVAQQVGGGTYAINSLTPLDTILKIASNIANNATQINAVKENYLPRDGSKPMTGNLVLGEHKDSLTLNEEGNKLFFRGTYANSDGVWMGKATPGNDVTELRVRIGDNVQSSSRDAFVVGGASYVEGLTWKEQFRVQTDGKVGIGVTNPLKSLDLDARGDYVRFRNLEQVNVTSQKPLVMNTAGDVGVASQSILTPLATETTAGKLEVASYSEAIETSNSSLYRKIMTPGRVNDHLRYHKYAKNKLYGTFTITGIGSNDFRVSGGFSSASRVFSVGPDSYYRLNFSNSVFGSYSPIAVVESRGVISNQNNAPNWNRENDAILTFRDLNTRGLSLIFREVSDHGNLQIIRVRIQIIN